MKIIGIGDIAVSNAPEETIRTYSLGSCVAIIMRHPPTGIGAMAHVALYSDKFGEAQRRKEKPGYYANTAIETLITKLKIQIKSFDEKEFKVALIGGASVLKINTVFNIGEKNVNGIKKGLKEAGFEIEKEETGGSVSRTVTLELPSGKITVKSPGQDPWEL